MVYGCPYISYGYNSRRNACLEMSMHVLIHTVARYDQNSRQDPNTTVKIVDGS